MQAPTLNHEVFLQQYQQTESRPTNQAMTTSVPYNQRLPTSTPQTSPPTRRKVEASVSDHVILFVSF